MHTVFLKYLDEVARQGSIRKAASVLNVTSTSVNRKIIQVEEQLGVRILDRSPEGVELTTSGRIILEHCRKTLYDFEQTQALLGDIRGLKTGHLSIQVIDSVAFGFLPKVLEQFGNAHPGISLSVTVAQPDEVTQAVASAEADIGISFTKMVHPNVRVVTEKPAPLGVLMAVDHPLAERASVSIDDLSAYPLVRTLDARGRNSLIDQDIASVASPLRTQLYSNTLAIARQAILSSQMIGIYTKIGFQGEIEQGRLKFASIRDTPLGDYRIGLLVSALSNIDLLKGLFLGVVERVLRQLDFT
ncbi:LysR family transcriptional regulator [Rhizobium sp. S95]|uniref:LysR family transcriptional regulator n=1 Tax=Ciceribacter sichuanensis TaxID=2949647 RepID=A0AAJ1F6G3_9HYPH|nr:MULTISPECIES: LysR family transcriptional regulator [unclassified Ciceribacter]MCM2395724.1 LysR family transcriptional regulator [Ciceribacter sp. S95]MCM2402473.1 LysR family transcriptional regulator [Ciceribacter sp. S153]MCO5958925.1 LysR family transcriptional regulator [Ciceribacter sp. S101]